MLAGKLLLENIHHHTLNSDIILPSINVRGAILYTIIINISVVDKIIIGVTDNELLCMTVCKTINTYES